MTDSHDYIKTAAELHAFCAKATPALLEGDFLTFDTEFIRERTYAPQLCLIQIATNQQAAIVDPLAEGMDLAPLLEVFANEKMVKVLHAGRQDLEIFLELMGGDLPKNVFDTQIAAMVCGFGESAGYETLVKKIAKKSIDKSSRFSNWAARPLTPKQLDYAISDVTHLRDIYRYLLNEITKNKREQWIQEEMAALLNPKTYEVDFMRLLFKLKLRTSKPHVLARAFHLVKWREAQAASDDKPRQNIIRDDLIGELATQYPKTAEEFCKTRGIRDRRQTHKMAEAIIDVMHKASALEAAECPQLPSTPNEAPIDPLTQELLRVLLKYISDKEEVAEKILAPSKDLAALIRHKDQADLPCLKGWRYDIFGKIALDFMDEKIALSVKDGKVLLTNTS